jgi:eukaryotic-like serine/threonine-protein kinase
LSTDLRDQLQATLGGSYDLDRELGGGGMSRVFVAEEKRLGRKVVIKVLPVEMAAGMSAERFEREIRVAAGLQHPHIVPLLSAGEIDGQPYYTMPFVTGRSLRARLAEGPLPVAEAIAVLRDVAKALAYAHAEGVVHRDIKPDNVLLSGGSAVVTDFGIAKAVSAARGEGMGVGMPTLTAVGTSLGTPSYMAPEQAAADPSADHRVDIYAYGIMAYELLAGHPPFVASSPQKLLAAHMGERPMPIGEIRPDIPQPLADMVMRCLAKDAAERPQTAEGIARRLDVTSGEGRPAMPGILVGGTGRIWRGLAMYVAAFAAVVILARAAIVGIGLPEWVFTGAVIVMALGLPVIVATALMHWATQKAMTVTPALTPGGSPAPQGTMATLAMKASPHLTWRRAAAGGWLAVGSFVLLVTGYVVTRAIGIGPAGSLTAMGKLSEGDRLVVADFHVSGADSSLGTVLAEVVRTDLAQSSVVAIMSTAAITGVLRRMERSPDTRVVGNLAREIAVREGAKGVVDGNVTPIGNGFIVQLRLSSADSGVVLASFQGTAPSPTELLLTLGKLTKSMRAKLGESLKKVQATPPLSQVTTASLPALRKHVEASRAMGIEVDNEKAIGLFREAIALDSNFAMAYRGLGMAAGNAGLPRAVKDSAITKAYQYRNRLTDRERLITTADYFLSVARDRAQSVATYEELLSKRPDDIGALNNLAISLGTRREYPRAESLLKRIIDVDSGRLWLAYGNLARTQVDLGKLDEAEKTLESGRAKFGPQLGPRLVLGVGPLVPYARGDLDSVDKILATLRKSPQASWRADALGSMEAMARLRGQLALAARHARDREVENAARGVPPRPQEAVIDAARTEFWFLNRPDRGVAMLDSVLGAHPLAALPEDQRPYFDLATAYAMAGRPDRAKALLAQYDAEVGDTTLRRFQQPFEEGALAIVALSEKRYVQAIEGLRRSDRRPDGPVGGCTICVLFPLAYTFDAANMQDSAIVYYERFLNSPQGNRMFEDAWSKAASLKRLGELYAARNQPDKAAGYYRQFVNLWKDADPELQPQVADVRRRLERLPAAERR